MGSAQFRFVADPGGVAVGCPPAAAHRLPSTSGSAGSMALGIIVDLVVRAWSPQSVDPVDGSAEVAIVVRAEDRTPPRTVGWGCSSPASGGTSAAAGCRMGSGSPATGILVRPIILEDVHVRVVHLGRVGGGSDELEPPGLGPAVAAGRRTRCGAVLWIWSRKILIAAGSSWTRTS